MKLVGIEPSRNMRCDTWRCGGVNAVVMKSEGATNGTGHYLCAECAKEYVRILTERFGEAKQPTEEKPAIVETIEDIVAESNETIEPKSVKDIKQQPVKRPPIPSKR